MLVTKIINPIDVDSNVAVGLKLNLVPTGSFFFGCNYTTVEQYKDNIKNLILTSLGERIMLPGFGSELQKYLFEIYNNKTVDLYHIISSAIETWISGITVDQIEVIDDNIDKNIVKVSIFFHVNSISNKTEKVDITTRVQ